MKGKQVKVLRNLAKRFPLHGFCEIEEWCFPTTAGHLYLCSNYDWIFYTASCTLDVAFLFSRNPFAEPWELYESATDSVNNDLIIFYYYLFFFLEIVPV